MNPDFRKYAPPVSDTADLNMPEISTRVLDSGIKVTTHRSCDADVCYITLIREGGTAEAQSPAVSALASGLINEGTASFDSETIADTLDRNGAWLTTGTSAHHRRLSLYSLNSQLPHVLPILSEITGTPAFPDDIVQIRTQILAQNIGVSQQDVNYLAHCLSDKMIMGNHHPLARIDTPDEILAITPSAIRQFHQKYNSATSTHLFISGNIDENTETLIINAVNHIPANPVKAPLIITPYTPMPHNSVMTSALDHATQSAVVITIPGIPRNHTDYIPLNLTVLALGGYFGSRLMTNIREEKGLTYGIRASLLGQHDGSHIEISAETDNKSTTRLIEEVRSELARLSSDPPRGEELTRIKRAATTSMRAIIDNPFGPIDFRMTMLTSDIPETYFKDKIDAIKALTPDTIARIATTYLRPDTILTAVSGSHS
ncbi:MAG: insulinase family protein [Paramuribaculum sp.]|nr:insulinase family protein [Paramuribaculum sp.]